VWASRPALHHWSATSDFLRRDRPLLAGVRWPMVAGSRAQNLLRAGPKGRSLGGQRQVGMHQQALMGGMGQRPQPGVAGWPSSPAPSLSCTARTRGTWARRSLVARTGFQDGLRVDGLLSKKKRYAAFNLRAVPGTPLSDAPGRWAKTVVNSNQPLVAGHRPIGVG